MNADSITSKNVSVDMFPEFSTLKKFDIINVISKQI